MQNADCRCKTEQTQTDRGWILLLAENRYRLILTVCVMSGIMAGSMTQAFYGDTRRWQDAVELYGDGFFTPLICIAPITTGFIVLIFILAFSRLTRCLIYPASVFRGMGIGTLLCGAVQCGRLRELCFATIVLLPYAAVNCALAIQAGEYALGYRESFSGEHGGMTGRLIVHAVKMVSLYLVAAVITCLLFAGSCYLFGKYLI